MVPRGRRPPPPPNANTHKVVVLIVYVHKGHVRYQFTTTRTTTKDLLKTLFLFIFRRTKKRKKERGTRVKIIIIIKSSRNNKCTKNRRAKTTDSFAPLLSKKSIEKARCGARTRECECEREMDVWFGTRSGSSSGSSSSSCEKEEEKDEKLTTRSAGEVSRLQSPIKPFPPARKKEKEDKEEREEKDESNRQSVLSPTTSTSTTTTGGSAKHSEYNSSPENASELRTTTQKNDDKGEEKVGRRLSTARYMLTKESYDVDSSNATNAKTIDDDDEEEEEEEEEGGVLHDDEEGMRSSTVLYENPDLTLVEEDEDEEEEEEGEEEEEEGRKKKGKKSEHNKKKMARVERLREYFELPPGEELLDEFLCALYKKILLQGRMYVFNNYVCFYSSVFGYQKRKRIPFKEVTMLEKAKTAGIFNNALYIVHQDGKREFFTSFIFPEKVFKFLEQKWKMSSDYGRLFRGHRRHESMDFDETLRLKEEQRMLAQLGDSDLSDTEENSEERKISNMLGKQTWTDMPVLDSERSHEQMKSLRRGRRRSEHRESTEDNTDDLSSNTATTGDNIEENEAISEKRRATTLDPTTSKTHWDNEEEEEKEKERGTREEIANEEESDDFGEIPRMRTLPDDGKDESARIPDEYGKGLVSAKLDCTVKEFFKACFSNSASHTFFLAQTKALGQTNFSCTEWAKHSHYGFSRDIKFVAPLNSTFGPKETRCVQTQTYKLYPDDNLVIGYSQVHLDIPYGDYFSVESKWNCVPISTNSDGKMNGCEVTFHVHVLFEKYTYLHSVIRSSVLSETKESAAAFLNAAKSLLNKSVKGKSSAMSEAKSATFLERLSRQFSIDVTKMKIPEGSRDAVFSMLYPSAGKVSEDTMRPMSTAHQTTASFSTHKSTKDKFVSGIQCTRHLAKKFFSLFTIQNLLMFVLLVAVTWTLLAMCASCVNKLWSVVKYPFIVIFGDSDANLENYWERRIAILTQELGALERKVQLVSKEITFAKQSLKEVSS